MKFVLFALAAFVAYCGYLSYERSLVVTDPAAHADAMIALCSAALALVFVGLALCDKDLRKVAFGSQK